MVDQYHKEEFSHNFHKIGGMFLRTVPVHKSVPVTHHVAMYDDAVEILNVRRESLSRNAYAERSRRYWEAGVKNG